MAQRGEGRTMKIKNELIELISLEGKVAAISGAASGIGLASARRLAEAGAAVALLDVDSDRGRKALEEVKKIEDRVRFYRCDVTLNAECQKAAEDIQQDFGSIDILFNNAGVIRRKDIIQLDEDEWNSVLDVNLKGVYLLSRSVIPFMVKNGGGSIINNSSGWGLRGGPDAAAYCAAKGGVVTLTKAMAIDHGKQGIRVNCICPGDTDTPLLRDEASQLGEEESAYLKQAADRPLGRVGRPEDIANAVLFLASDMSSWVTGSILVVDGGGLA